MQDITLDTDYDLKFKQYDFDITDTTSQEIQLICLYGEGQLKQYPTFGVDILKFQNGIWNQTLKSKIQSMLRTDGFIVNKVAYIDNQIKIDAYKNE